MKLKVLLSVFVSLVLVIFSSSLVLGIEYGCEDCNPPPHAIDECSPCSGLRQAKCTGWCNGEWWPQCSEYKDPGCNSGLSCCWGLSCDNDHCCANDQLWMNSDCCDKWGAAGCGSGDDCCAGTVCTDNHCCNPGEEWDSEAGSCVPGDDPTDYCDEQTNPDGWCANKNANKPLCCGPGTNSHCEACKPDQ